MLQWKKSINLITNGKIGISIHKAQRHWNDHISVLGLHHYLILFCVPSYNDVSGIIQCPELLSVWQASIKVEEALCCLSIPALPSGCCKELHLFTKLAAKARTFRTGHSVIKKSCSGIQGANKVPPWQVPMSGFRGTYLYFL